MQKRVKLRVRDGGTVVEGRERPHQRNVSAHLAAIASRTDGADAIIPSVEFCHGRSAPGGYQSQLQAGTEASESTDNQASVSGSCQRHLHTADEHTEGAGNVTEGSAFKLML